MRIVLSSLPRMVVMAAIVDSVLFLPVTAILALLCFALFGIPLQSLITFGGALSAPHGVIVWWAAFLIPSLVYAAYAMPWRPRE